MKNQAGFTEMYGASVRAKMGYNLLVLIIVGWTYVLTLPELKGVPENLNFIDELIKDAKFYIITFVAVFMLIAIYFHAYMTQKYFKKSLIKSGSLLVILIVAGLFFSTVGPIFVQKDYDNYIKNRTAQLSGNISEQKFKRSMENLIKKLDEKETELVIKDYQTVQSHSATKL